MKIYHAITDAEIIPRYYDKTGNKMNVMISYAYLAGNAYKVTQLYRDRINSLCLDSGAFSSFGGKAKIWNLEYSNYLKIFGNRFDEFVALDDSLDDPNHNFINLRALEEIVGESGKKAIPVIHDPDNPHEEIEMYIEMGYPYIALGSMGLNKRIDPKIILRVRKEYPDIKLHLFGNLTLKVLEQYKPYSADSSHGLSRAEKAEKCITGGRAARRPTPTTRGERTPRQAKIKHIKKSPF